MASWCCSASRIAHSGTAARFTRGAPACSGDWHCAAAAPTYFRSAIASLHAEDTSDWSQIRAFYDELVRLTRSPVVQLNRAVAVAETAGPEAGLEAVAGLELESYRYLHSARADFLRRLGRPDEARAAYQRAIELTDSTPERRFLARRLAELGCAEQA